MQDGVWTPAEVAQICINHRDNFEDAAKKIYERKTVPEKKAPEPKKATKKQKKTKVSDSMQSIPSSGGVPSFLNGDMKVPFGVMAQSVTQGTQSAVNHANGGSNGGTGVPHGLLNGSINGLPANKPNLLAQNLKSNDAMEAPIGSGGDNTSSAMPKNVDLSEEKPNSLIQTIQSPSNQQLPPGQTQRWQGKYPDLNPVPPLIQSRIQDNVMATNHSLIESDN